MTTEHELLEPIFRAHFNKPADQDQGDSPNVPVGEDYKSVIILGAATLPQAALEAISIAQTLGDGWTVTSVQVDHDTAAWIAREDWKGETP